MELLMDIAVRQTIHPKLAEADLEHLEYGKYLSDHMLICDYDGRGPAPAGWQQPAIVPFGNLSLSPATLALHYGQTVFEGMKAFRMQDGRTNIFRLERHYERFTRSLDRMCMAIPPAEIFYDGLIKLVALDRGWVPAQPGSALYLRPFMYASEAKPGLKISEQYRFVIITGPVPELYAKPVKVKVETNYTRAGKGGTGYAKCGGNYGGAFYPTKLAREQGYEQVLWTDGQTNEFIEESGMMNIMFVINNKLVTPSLSDSILDGVTRDSLLTLAKDLGYETEQRPVAVAELEKAFHDKTITEAFGAGTAAVVAPISTINIKGTDHHLADPGKESISVIVKTKLERIRRGIDKDIHGWNTVI